MNTPHLSGVDPLLVSRLSNEFAALGQQMGTVGRDLDFLRAQLAAPRPVVQQPAPQWQPQPVLPQRVPQPVPPPMPQWQPQPAQPQPAPPQPLPPRPWPPTPPAARTEPREPWWQRDGVISRLLAVAGAGVTLIGVVMLLVLAAQAGFFGPPLRVAAGALLSGVLVFVGTRVFNRSGGRVGGIALAATGIAGAFLDVIAVTATYGWLAPPLGLTVALAVAAGGVALAAKWQSQALALMVIVGVAILAPVVTDGVTLTLVAFLVVLQFACFPVQLVRQWPHLHTARTVPVVLAALLAITHAVVDSTPMSHNYALLAVCIVIAAFGIVSTLLSVRRAANDVTASVMLTVSTLPLLLSTVMFERGTVALVQGSLAAVLLAVAAMRMLPTHTRFAALAPAVVALLQTCVFVTRQDTLPIALLVVAAAFAAASEPVQSRVAYFTGLGFAVIGGLAYLDVVQPHYLANATDAVDGLQGVGIVSSVMVVALLALLVRQAHRLDMLGGGNIDVAWVLAGLAGLYAVTAAIVSTAVVLGGRDGFIAGHTVATIGWMGIATVLLMAGFGSLVNARVELAAGLALTAGAVAKLFLFDLATLDGLLRVAAFIVVGLLLLAVGTRYARTFAERTAEPSSAGSDVRSAR